MDKTASSASRDGASLGRLRSAQSLAKEKTASSASRDDAKLGRLKSAQSLEKVGWFKPLGWFHCIAEACNGICDPGPPGEEPAYLRLQRMHEEEERREAEERAADEERKRLNSLKVQEWQTEIASLSERRAELCGEDLDRDCDNYLEFFQVLKQENFDEAFAFEDASPTVGEPQDPTEEVQNEAVEMEAWQRPPDGPLEQWLASRFGPPSEGPSFGELVSCDAALVASLAQAFQAGAEEDERLQEEAEGVPKHDESIDFSEALDKLVEKYDRAIDVSNEEDAVSPEVGSLPACASIASAPRSRAAEAAREEAIIVLKARSRRRREAAGRLVAMQPLLEGDGASARFAAALTALIAGDGGEAAGVSEEHLAPLWALSTADACWGACSEKRKLLFDGLLPATGADGSGGTWSCWKDLRRAAPALWLSAAELDDVVTKLTQVSLQRLRRALAASDAKTDLDDAESQRDLRSYADEALFWSVAGRAGLDSAQAILTKLRSLLRTGALRGEPALETLLKHERSEEPDFLRKNAFRLLQLQRFYLSAALFVIGGSLEEAANVAARRLGDLQLALVLARRESQVVQMLLRELQELPAARQDPWLRLISWSAPVSQGARCASKRPPLPEEALMPAPSADDTEGEVHATQDTLVDGCLRLTSTPSVAPLVGSQALTEAARLLGGG